MKRLILLFAFLLPVAANAQIRPYFDQLEAITMEGHFDTLDTTTRAKAIHDLAPENRATNGYYLSTKGGVATWSALDPVDIPGSPITIDGKINVTHAVISKEPTWTVPDEPSIERQIDAIDEYIRDLKHRVYRLRKLYKQLEAR